MRRYVLICIYPLSFLFSLFFSFYSFFSPLLIISNHVQKEFVNNATCHGAFIDLVHLVDQRAAVYKCCHFFRPNHFSFTFTHFCCQLAPPSFCTLRDFMIGVLRNVLCHYHGLVLYKYHEVFFFFFFFFFSFSMWQNVFLLIIICIVGMKFVS